jgi:hypothetical protein
VELLDKEISLVIAVVPLVLIKLLQEAVEEKDLQVLEEIQEQEQPLQFFQEQLFQEVALAV